MTQNVWSKITSEYAAANQGSMVNYVSSRRAQKIFVKMAPIVKLKEILTFVIVQQDFPDFTAKKLLVQIIRVRMRENVW